MPIIESSYIIINENYKRGIVLDEYNGVYSIIEAHEGKDERIWPAWGFRQLKTKQAAEKAIPWKIELGDVYEAMKNLNLIIASLKNIADGKAPAKSKQQRGPARPPGKSQFQEDPEDNDGIPF